MNFSFGELWASLDNYPKKLTYYDNRSNEEDVITDHSEMEEFAQNVEDYAVERFGVSEYDSGFALEVVIA